MTAAWPGIGTVQFALIQLVNIDLRTTFQPDLAPLSCLGWRVEAAAPATAQ
jgi:hypothetical protein